MERKRKITHEKIGKIGEAILLGVAGAGAISILILFPGMAHLIAPFIKKKSFRKRDIQKNLDSLVRSGLLKMQIGSQGKMKLELTRKGKWEAFLRYKSQDTVKDKWDGIWRVVIFDVPISKNKIRRELRRAMLLFGFKMLQQSVWVYPHACDDFITLLKTNLGVSNDVLYMKVRHIENDIHLRKEFNL